LIIYLKIIAQLLNNMKLLIKPSTSDIKLLYSNHSHYNQGDSGLDLFFPEDVTLQKGDRGVMIPLGIQCEALSKVGDHNLSYYLYPRSSISKTPIRMANSVGIIDAGYRGQIIVALDLIDPTIDSYTIQKGTRLFQICSPTLDPIHLTVVDSLSETSRGNDGFGSTGR
jgi:dUTP pyrophosphatase